MRAIAIAAVLLLAGCVATPAGPDAPAQVFAGSCADIFDLESLDEALGGGWSDGAPIKSRLELNSKRVPNAGGIACWWSNDDNQGLLATVIPADAVSAPEDAACGFETEQGASSCAVDVTANGMRLVGLYTAASGDASDLSAAVAALKVLFTQSAMDAAEVRAPTRAPGAWPSAIDCASLDVPGANVVDPGLGTIHYVSPVQLALNGGQSAPFCRVSELEVTFLFAALGGGRWMEGAVRAAVGAEIIDVDGVDLVILVPSNDSYSVNVFDGPNWLQLPWFDGDDDSVYATVALLVDALNDLN